MINMARPLLLHLGGPSIFVRLMLAYDKPFVSLPDQLALLKSRGLHVADDNAALECLHRNGYYRLSAFWYPFRIIVPQLDSRGKQLRDKHEKPLQKRSDQFLPGSTFENARDLYVFDKIFKMLLLDAIERVEIAVRADISLTLGALDKFAHLNPAFFRPSFITGVNTRGKTKYDDWLDKYEQAVQRSRDEFVQHHKKKYGSQSPLPIWIATELWDFGQLSHFYSGMKTSHCISIATRFAIPDWRLMESWLRSLNYVRNIIAHHGRLWNNALVIQPAVPPQGLISDFDVLLSNPILNTRIYFVCCILCHFSKVVNPQSTWPQQLKTLINNFPTMPHVSIQDMGFPSDWQNHEF